jgi:hypothetical protein
MPRRNFLRVKTSLLERETRRENWQKKCFGQKISPGGRNLFRRSGKAAGKTICE